VDIRRTGSAKDGEDVIGNASKAKVVKNKVAPPFKDAKFDIVYGKGIDYVSDIIEMGVEYKLIEKSGTWYSMGEERLGQGKVNVKKYFINNSEVLEGLIENMYDILEQPLPNRVKERVVQENE
jgi:recombination protein RecA